MKTSIRLTGFLILLMPIATAFGSSTRYPSYVEECKAPAFEKLKTIAQIGHFELDEASLSITGIDDRWYNPTKYVWFSAVMRMADQHSEVVQVLTQKSFAPAKICF